MMKHLKKFNEDFTSFYDRTIGFRYSKPSIAVNVIIYFAGTVLTEENVKSILDDIDVPVEKIVIEEKKQVFRLPSLDDEEAMENVESDGVISFEMKVYSDKEVDRILRDFAKSMFGLGSTPVTGDSNIVEE